MTFVSKEYEIKTKMEQEQWLQGDFSWGGWGGGGDEHLPSRENPVKGNPMFSNIPKSLPENPPNSPILCN